MNLRRESYLAAAFGDNLKVHFLYRKSKKRILRPSRHPTNSDGAPSTQNRKAVPFHNLQMGSNSPPDQHLPLASAVFYRDRSNFVLLALDLNQGTLRSKDLDLNRYASYHDLRTAPYRPPSLLNKPKFHPNPITT